MYGLRKFQMNSGKRKSLAIFQNYKAIFACVIITLNSNYANAQTLATGESFEPPYLKLALGLVLCTVVAYIVVYLLKSLKLSKTGVTGLRGLNIGLSGNKKNRISILETHRLNATTDICLLNYDDEEYLVLVGSSGYHILKQPSSGELEK